MALTIQAFKVLGALTKCQPKPRGIILVIEEEEGSCTFSASDKDTASPYDFEKTMEVLDYLELKHMIAYEEKGIVKILHTGRHRIQILLGDGFAEFVRSVFCPILVSILTALCFCALSARFSWFSA